jgi:hypothetical protein
VPARVTAFRDFVAAAYAARQSARTASKARQGSARLGKALSEAAVSAARTSRTRRRCRVAPELKDQE